MNEPVTGVKLFLSIVPDHMVEALASMAERMRLDKWDIGDITNSIKGIVEEHAYPIGIMDVYEGISILLRNEVSARTVRYYAAVADFYSVDLRRRYDPLPFSHFEYAMGFEFWEDILNGSLALFDDRGGKPASLTQVAMKFQERINGHNPSMSGLSEPPDDYDRTDNGHDAAYDDIADTVGSFTGPIAARMKRTLEKIDEVLDEFSTLNLPPAYEKDLRNATEQYKNNVHAIMQEWMRELSH